MYFEHVTQGQLGCTVKTLLRKIRMHCENVTQGQLGCAVNKTNLTNLYPSDEGLFERNM